MKTSQIPIGLGALLAFGLAASPLSTQSDIGFLSAAASEWTKGVRSGLGS